MSYTEILTDHGSTVEIWDKEINHEYIGQTFMHRLMGKGTDKILQFKRQLSKTAGDAITFTLAGEQEGGRVDGNVKGIGNEGRQQYYNQRVTIDNVRFLHKIWDLPMTQKRVNFNVISEAKSALIRKNKKGMDEDVITALTTIGSERVRGRYLYGAADSNWNATHSTALTAVDGTNDMLTVAMVDIAKRKAQIPINATLKIQPSTVNIGNGMRDGVEEWMVFLGHTFCMRDLLTSDASWKNAELNLPPNPKRSSVLFTGSSFKGARNGVLYHEVEQLPLIASTIQVAHCLLLGAGAGYIGWGQMTKTNEEFEDLKHNITYETHEIRGIDKAVWNLSTTEDAGLINVFPAAVAD